MFRQTVAIIRFYPNLYAKKECLYNVRHRVSMVKSHHLRVGQSFFFFSLYGLGVDFGSRWSGPVDDHSSDNQLMATIDRSV